MEETKVLETLRDDYAERYGFRDEATYLYETPRGLSRRVVEEISFPSTATRRSRISRSAMDTGPPSFSDLSGLIFP
jgi:hypothetical protein